MVHTSPSSLGFVCGGAQIVIEALLEAVGTVQKVALGNDTLTFMKQREVVVFAIKWIEQNRK